MRPHNTLGQVRADLGPGDWWLACEHPERPPDRWAVWDWGCDACFLAMQVAVHRGDNFDDIDTVMEGDVLNKTDLVTALLAATAWRRENLDA